MNAKEDKNKRIIDGVYVDGFAFWDDVKKYFYFLYMFIFILCLIPILFGTPIVLVLFLELMTTPMILLIFMIRYVIVPHKSRLIKRIEGIEKERHVTYEKFTDTINCSARSPGSLIFFSLFQYLLIFVIFLGIDEPHSPELVILLVMLFFYAIILPGIFNRRKDRIWVDPRNQGYIFKKKYFFFFFGKKQFYNWSNLKITIFGEKIELLFNNESKSYFKPEDDDYLKIIPKAFRAFKGNDEIDKMIALKAITMYNTKKVVRLFITIGIVLTIAFIEVFFLTNAIFG